MLKFDLKTQIFYLNRMFYILSDGYNPPHIEFNPDWLDTSSITQVDDEQKLNIPPEELDVILDKLFKELYEHNKALTDAPKIFAQNWNNEFVLKSIQETKNNILEYVKNKEVTFRTYNDIIEDDYQIVEFIYENEQRKDIILFKKEFH